MRCGMTKPSSGSCVRAGGRESTETTAKFAHYGDLIYAKRDLGAWEEHLVMVHVWKSRIARGVLDLYHMMAGSDALELQFAPVQSCCVL